MKPSFIFFGTPDISAETLQVLFDNGHIPKLVITGPDRAIGRHQSTLLPSPVKQWAEQHGINILQPEKIDAAFLEQIKNICNEVSIDVFVVVAYGKILPESLIHIPKYGTLNIHYSLLPRWRGACPTEASILSNDQITGVTIQSMVYELDAGDILATTETIILPDETTPELRGRLSILGSELLVDTLNNLEEKLAKKTPQDITKITRCGKIKKTDGQVNQNDDLQEIYRKWRAYQPWPGIYYFDKHGKRIKITEMKQINNIPVITKIIPEGGKEQIIKIIN